MRSRCGTGGWSCGAIWQQSASWCVLSGCRAGIVSPIWPLPSSQQPLLQVMPVTFRPLLLLLARHKHAFACSGHCFRPTRLSCQTYTSRVRSSSVLAYIMDVSCTPHPSPFTICLNCRWAPACPSSCQPSPSGGYGATVPSSCCSKWVSHGP